MHYGVKHNIPVICWESVQQAWTVGRPLLDYLRDRYCVPNGYRIAHLFINAASFGNAQHRKRYFFLAYKDDKLFNIVKPNIPDRHSTVRDVLNTVVQVDEPHVSMFKGDYSPDSFMKRPPDDVACMPVLPQGRDMNWMGRNMLEELRAVSPKYGQTWDLRTSDMPFSMHCIQRLHPDKFMPVISGSAGRFVHPDHDRPITVRECAKLMGWGDIVPCGPNPIGQIGKGICPEVGKWLAEQVMLYLDDHWKDDWESSYDDKTGRWNGDYFSDRPVEKKFDLTRYCPEKP
jgi:site-specific DNA-cytosine methylase